jgi:hypothetical protein
MFKLYCVIEVEDADTLEEARQALDNFREAIVPSQEYGITIYEDDSREGFVSR